MRRTWYRIDGEPPSRWSWRAFPQPRGRFDSAGGLVRVRYAADSARGAMRERFDGTGRIVSAEQLEHHLVRITGTLRLLDLRAERTLDALGLDDQINTSRAPGPWAACQRLTDLAIGWFGERIDGIAYRSRTTPQRGTNLALWGHRAVAARSMGRLRTRQGLLVASALGDGFAFEGWHR